MTTDDLAYSIDASDVIASVSSSFPAFAAQNGWTGNIGPDQVVGHSIWRFIEGKETRHLYEEAFKVVRIGMPFGPISFRCDSPTHRRFLELHLFPLRHGDIELLSKTVKLEKREVVPLLDPSVSHGPPRVTTCSICKKIETSASAWVEAEDALAALGLPADRELPGLNHGVCPQCHERLTGELHQARASGHGGGNPGGQEP